MHVPRPSRRPGTALSDPIPPWWPCHGVWSSRARPGTPSARQTSGLRRVLLLRRTACDFSGRYCCRRRACRLRDGRVGRRRTVYRASSLPAPVPRSPTVPKGSVSTKSIARREAVRASTRARAPRSVAPAPVRDHRRSRPDNMVMVRQYHDNILSARIARIAFPRVPVHRRAGSQL